MDNLEKYNINGSTVYRGRLSKVGGVFLANAPQFIIRPLSKNDAKEMGNLSETIYQHLTKGQECFIHKHDKEYYNNIFNNSSIHYIGVFVGSKLVGMSYIRLCNNKESLDDEIPNSPTDFFERDGFNLAAALGADSVHPDYRGNHLNQIMIGCRLEYANEFGCSGAFSIIDRNNRWNMSPYFNNGFHMFATTVDPSDGGQIALLHHNMNESKEKSSNGINIPYNRFDLIDNLLDRGYIGNGFENESGFIKFVPTGRTIRTSANDYTFAIMNNKGAKCV